MKEKITRLARGYVDFGETKLTLTPQTILETAEYSRNYKGEFRIGSESGLLVRGVIYSTNSRVTLLSETFSASRAHIAYNVDTDAMSDGEQIEGEFQLVTSAGD